jgi:predicted DsbA family dithiol-disulfide isomerase
MSETETTVEVTVYSDYVCPFCYLGRQSLEQYEETREAPIRVDWHPFDLRAGKRNEDGTIDHEADDGKDEAYYEQARENVRRLQEQYDVGMVEELRTDVDSLNAQLVSYRVRETEAYGTWLAFDEAVFDALWKEGQDIGDPEVLEDIAADTGVDPGVVEGALEDDTLRGELDIEFDRAKRQGVTGVPTFACDGTAARGAVPPEHLRRLVEGTGG